MSENQPPKPPYYAVIFTSKLKTHSASYEATAQRMLDLAYQQPGFLGVESAREEIGITVSYWRDLESIAGWRSHLEHQQAQQLGRDQWYEHYRVRIAKVERQYGVGTDLGSGSQ